MAPVQTLHEPEAEEKRPQAEERDARIARTFEDPVQEIVRSRHPRLEVHSDGPSSGRRFQGNGEDSFADTGILALGR